MFMGKIFRGQDIYEINGFQATAKCFMLFTDADISRQQNGVSAAANKYENCNQMPQKPTKYKSNFKVHFREHLKENDIPSFCFAFFFFCNNKAKYLSSNNKK